jgi:hypothetical protein
MLIDTITSQTIEAFDQQAQHRVLANVHQAAVNYRQRFRQEHNADNE